MKAALVAAREHTERLAQAEAAIAETEAALREAETAARVHRAASERRSRERAKELAKLAVAADGATVAEARAQIREAREADEAEGLSLDGTCRGFADLLDEKRLALRDLEKASPTIFHGAILARAAQIGEEYLTAVEQLEDALARLQALSTLAKGCDPASPAIAVSAAPEVTLPGFRLPIAALVARMQKPRGGVPCPAPAVLRWCDVNDRVRAAEAEELQRLAAAGVVMRKGPALRVKIPEPSLGEAA